MSDPHPPEPGTEPGTEPADPVAGDPPATGRTDLSAPADAAEDAPRGPGIDLSEPEPAPTAGAPVEADPPDAAPPPTPPAAAAPAEPQAPDAAPPMTPPTAPAAAAPAEPDAPDAAPPMTPPPAPPAGAAPAAPADPPAAKPRSDAWKMVLVVAVFVGVVVVAFVMGRSGGSKTDPGGVAATTTTVNTTPVDTSDWATYDDPASGFSLKHPKDWVITGPPEGQNRLLISAGEQNFLLVTARTIDPATVESDIAQAMSEQDVITGPQRLQLDGQPAVLYIYNSPTTAENKVEGVIIHYFIVRDTKMYSMIFQARPKEELNRLARTYNAVTNSFKSTSDVEPPAPLPTTAP